MPNNQATGVASHYFSRQPPSPPGQEKTASRHTQTMRVCGVELQLSTGVGVFSKAGLDAGSRLLIETALRDAATWPSGTRICDLGCGWGALGCFAARLAPQTSIWMCDVNQRAAALARYNATTNELGNTCVWCGDGLAATRADFFDMVLCNPPVRAGNAVIARLFKDAQRCLHPQGVLWVVLRTAQGAKSWQKRLQTQFGHCETVAIEGGYRILKSIKQ